MENEIKYEKAKYYKEKVRPAHVDCYGMFYNGIVLDVKPEFLILDDEKLGEMPIFFSEIHNIEPREPKERKDE